MSVWLSDGDTTEKTFKILAEMVTLATKNVEKELNEVKSQLEIGEIARIEKLPLEDVEIRLLKPNTYSYDDKPCIFFPSGLANALNELGFVSGEGYGGSRKIYFVYTEEDQRKALLLLDELKKLSLKVHQENIEKSVSNAKVYESLMNLMERIGIQKTYYDYPNKRTRTKKALTHSWVGEISAQIPRNYPKNKLDDLHKSFVEKLNKIFAEEFKKIAEKKRLQEQDAERKESERKLAFLLAKYELSIMGTWDDLMEAILSKNKYLRLAHYLEKNRGDWSEGYSYAEAGLRGFTVENEPDGGIAADIYSCIKNWDGDGRVFRDTEWNYNAIFKLVKDEDLLKDYQEVKSHFDY